MNIQNFTPFEPTWHEIFEKQRELKFLYEPEAKELFENFDIDCFEDQELFKKYCWRITEELTEAIEAFRSDGKDHTEEELIDALNFTIELMLLYGWGPEVVINNFSSVDTPYFGYDEFPGEVGETIYALGLAANCLKNRQWRRSHHLVDLYVFEKRLLSFLKSLYGLLQRRFCLQHIDDCLVNWHEIDRDIRKAWSLKYQVNLFRIQTNY